MNLLMIRNGYVKNSRGTNTIYILNSCLPAIVQAPAYGMLRMPPVEFWERDRHLS